ncbi:CoA transferase [Pararobbsia alpina]|uniref:CoA transferase n=1 Tax=Pararobbsia alpina TaxID=621374 RepID=UPI0039A5CB5E
MNRLSVTGEGALPSVFPVTDFAVAAMGAASLAIAELVSVETGRVPAVEVDRRLASLWFGVSLQAQGWSVPPLWDTVAGDYRAADGWIRLHTNAPHHRAAALAVLGVTAERDAVAHAVAQWKANELEAAVVARGGCAAAMRSIEQWHAHPQGEAVALEPVLAREHRPHVDPVLLPHATRARPLAGVRVLDLTRILAGPVATRFLAGFGADVLRIDPPGWDEASTIPDVVLGKRCARLDLKSADGLGRLEQLLRSADVFVHGYRPDALERLGFGEARRRELNPSIVDVSLDAYGWSGPWHARRGFDSLIQMSTGIADAGMRATRVDKPVPLPLQAIDHATGYLMAAAAIRGLTERLTAGRPTTARASLARTARLLVDYPPNFDAAANGAQASLDGSASANTDHAVIRSADATDLDPDVEHTSWGPALRLRPAVSIDATPMHWPLPARKLGSDAPEWR